MIVREHIENCVEEDCPVAKRYNAYLQCGEWVINIGKEKN